MKFHPSLLTVFKNTRFKRRFRGVPEECGSSPDFKFGIVLRLALLQHQKSRQFGTVFVDGASDAPQQGSAFSNR